MELSDRKKNILAAVIDDYIEKAEPVGSKAISGKAGLGLSPATIRNEMAELEDMGFLEQPHTSAGRIPSPKGYRIYVNELMRRYKLSVEEAEEINRNLRQRLMMINRLVSDIGFVAARLTSYPAWALTAPARVTISRFDLIQIDANSFIIVTLLSNNNVKNKLIHLPQIIEQGAIPRLSAVLNAHFTGIGEEGVTTQLIRAAERTAGDESGLTAAAIGFALEILSSASAGEAYLAGASQLLRQPEFRDPDKAHRLMDFISDGERLLELPAPEAAGNVKMIIGPENAAEELRDSSVVMASYDAGDNMRGLVGVVGPTRMDYAKVAARLEYLAGSLGRILAIDEAAGPPETDGAIKHKGDNGKDERQEGQKQEPGRSESG